MIFRIQKLALLAGAGQLLADLPGGSNLYSANITVKDQNGNGLAGVAVQLWVHTWYGEDETYDCFKNGVSGSGGAVYLECLIPAVLPTLEGLNNEAQIEFYTLISMFNFNRINS